MSRLTAHDDVITPQLRGAQSPIFALDPAPARAGPGWQQMFLNDTFCEISRRLLKILFTLFIANEDKLWQFVAKDKGKFQKLIAVWAYIEFVL